MVPSDPLRPGAVAPITAGRAPNVRGHAPWTLGGGGSIVPPRRSKPAAPCRRWGITDSRQRRRSNGEEPVGMGDVRGEDEHKDRLSRRTFLTRSAAAGGAVALGAAAGSALAGCGNSGASSSTTSARFERQGRREHQESGPWRVLDLRHGGRDRRLLPAAQPLGPERFPVRQQRVRPVDGGGRRRDGQALPVPDPHAQRGHGHLDHDPPPRDQVQRRLPADLGGDRGQLHRAQDLTAHRGRLRAGQGGHRLRLHDRRLQPGPSPTPPSRPPSPARSATPSAWP